MEKKDKKNVVKTDQVKKNSNFNKHNTIIAIAAIIIIIIIIVVIVAIASSSKKEKKPKEEIEKIYSTEETVENEYGFSKEDAINAVKGIYLSDNYTFDATIRKDNMYIVTVTNTDDKSEYKYIVDPNDGSFSMETEDEE